MRFPTMSAGSAVVIGLNAAVQKRFVLSPQDTLVPGNVHRATQVQTGVGGKGQDVAVSLACLSAPNVKLAQFVGRGPAGDLMLDLLQNQIGEDSATSLCVRTSSELRTCTTIVGSDSSTELVEPSGIISETEKEELLAKLKLSSEETTVSAVCVMGSMPPGLPDDMYAQMYGALSATNKCLCLIDSVVGLEQLLRTISKKDDRGPAMLKINASELCKLVGQSTNDCTKEEAIVAAAQQCFKKFESTPAIDALAITDGPYASYLICPGRGGELQVYKITTPLLDDSSTTLFPIGAGDSVAAGTLAAWQSLQCTNDESYLPGEIHKELKKRMQSFSLDGESHGIMETAFAFGLACGSASCLNEENSVLTPISKVLELFSAIPGPKVIVE